MLPLLQTRRQLYYKHGEESLRGLGGRGGAKESQNGAAAQASQLVNGYLLPAQNCSCIIGWSVDFFFDRTEQGK